MIDIYKFNFLKILSCYKSDKQNYDEILKQIYWLFLNKMSCFVWCTLLNSVLKSKDKFKVLKKTIAIT